MIVAAPMPEPMQSVVSAVSLPVGALVGLWSRPKERVISALMAFGGGALLAALSVDLVAPVLAEGHYTPAGSSLHPLVESSVTADGSTSVTTTFSLE